MVCSFVCSFKMCRVHLFLLLFWYGINRGKLHLFACLLYFAWAWWRETDECQPNKWDRAGVKVCFISWNVQLHAYLPPATLIELNVCLLLRRLLSIKRTLWSSFSQSLLILSPFSLCFSFSFLEMCIIFSLEFFCFLFFCYFETFSLYSSWFSSNTHTRHPAPGTWLSFSKDGRFFTWKYRRKMLAHNIFMGD